VRFYSDPAKYAEELAAEAERSFRRARDLIVKARALYAAGFEASGAEYVQGARQVSRAGRLLLNEARGTPERVDFS
jgi:hypothetical protein